VKRFKKVLLVCNSSSPDKPTLKRVVDLAKRNRARLKVVDIVKPVHNDEAEALGLSPYVLNRIAVQDKTAKLLKLLRDFYPDMLSLKQEKGHHDNGAGTLSGQSQDSFLKCGLRKFKTGHLYLRTIIKPILEAADHFPETNISIFSAPAAVAQQNNIHSYFTKILVF